MEGSIEGGQGYQKFHPIEVFWEKVTIIATLKKKKYPLIPFIHEYSTKVILDQCTGIIKPGTITAILGPSGKYK